MDIYSAMPELSVWQLLVLCAAAMYWLGIVGGQAARSRAGVEWAWRDELPQHLVGLGLIALVGVVP